MTEFNPLDTMRAIRDDHDLTTTHKGLLWAAVLRADNTGRDAGRVRASLELLAKDAGLSSKSAERAFRDERVLAYFRRVERRTRQVGLWFALTPDTVSVVKQLASSVPAKSLTPDTVSTTPDSLSTTPDTESDHLPVPLPVPLPISPSRPPKGKPSPQAATTSATDPDDPMRYWRQTS